MEIIAGSGADVTCDLMRSGIWANFLESVKVSQLALFCFEELERTQGTFFRLGSLLKSLSHHDWLPNAQSGSFCMVANIRENSSVLILYAQGQIPVLLL